MPEVVQINEKQPWFEGRIECNVTYRCNAICDHCDKAVGLATFPNTEMTAEQMGRAKDQFNDQGLKSRRVTMCGGEPVMNRELQGIINEASQLHGLPKKQRGRDPVGRVLSNGMPRTQAQRDKIDMPNAGWDWVINPLDDPDDPLSGKNDSSKRPNARVHLPFWISPADIGLEATWENCTVRGWCGKGFDSSGWAMCGKAGMFGRLLGIDPYGRSDVDVKDHVMTAIPDICKHCQYGLKKPVQASIAKDYWAGKLPFSISPTFSKLLKKYKDNPIQFDRY